MATSNSPNERVRRQRRQFISIQHCPNKKQQKLQLHRASTPLSAWPEAIAKHVCQYLSVAPSMLHPEIPNSLMSLGGTCKQLRTMIQSDEHLWKQMCYQRWPCLKHVAPSSYRGHYERCVSPQHTTSCPKPAKQLKAENTFALVTLTTLGSCLESEVLFSEAVSFDKMANCRLELTGSLQNAPANSLSEANIDVRLYEIEESAVLTLMDNNTSAKGSCNATEGPEQFYDPDAEATHYAKLPFLPTSEDYHLQVSLHSNQSSATCTLALEFMLLEEVDDSDDDEDDGVSTQVQLCTRTEVLAHLSAIDWA
jgi:hypothetical protein